MERCGAVGIASVDELRIRAYERSKRRDISLLCGSEHRFVFRGHALSYLGLPWPGLV